VDKNLTYFLGCSYFSGIGPLKFKRILSRFKSLSQAYWASQHDLIEALGRETANQFLAFRNVFDPIKKLEELNEKNITVLGQGEDDYPENLKNIADPPICLYVKGSLNRKSQFFSIVGTRQPTLYGRKVSYEISYGLAKVGITIVSGMAEGIDGMAHWAAIDAKGQTVAVLGNVDYIYPKTHIALYERIIASGGAIVSEFPPGVRLIKGMFVSRNRIISGISKGVLIVEGGEHSGTLITASYAANQGKDIFAIPGQITEESSLAPNILIKQGAKMVTQVDDIIQEYALKS
jgi:DNA processing protein